MEQTASKSSGAGDHNIPGIAGYGGHTGYNWDHKDTTFKGPHEPVENKVFDVHISSYAGHKPLNWNPHQRTHYVSGDPTKEAFAKTASLPRAARTAEGGAELWFGTIDQFKKK
mmetsp:Transcript_112233/g.194556  ORF Transcript_112233/g.194556 Transcript_112233/m.194556 type:complete len:113 (-) Transcript_112233:108-446(-)